jgi:DNA repair protein RadC
MGVDEKRLTIREWAEDDRPREKMQLRGVKSLSDSELLAILIGSGNKDETAVELARRMMHECNGSISELARLSIIDLCKRFKGIGTTKAITIFAALEFGRRRQLNQTDDRKKIKSSVDLYTVFDPIFIDLPHEEFWLAILNGANRIICTHRLTQGGTRQTIVDLPMLLRYAITHSAVSVAVAHNHPTGENKPSGDDENITRRIQEGCKSVGIYLIDHIIISRANYYSFADNGKL